MPGLLPDDFLPFLPLRLYDASEQRVRAMDGTARRGMAWRGRRHDLSNGGRHAISQGRPPPCVVKRASTTASLVRICRRCRDAIDLINGFYGVQF